jgi:hypothetical protein
VTLGNVAPSADAFWGFAVRSIKHPLSGAIYDLTEQGTIRVDKNGVTGEFDAQGRWLGGELEQADPHLCLWIAGRQLPNRFQQAAAALASTDASAEADEHDSPAAAVASTDRGGFA